MISQQDYSLQNATTPPSTTHSVSDGDEGAHFGKSGRGLLSLSWRGKLIFARTMSLAQLQAHQMIKPYQQLHYWSTVLFRRGSADVVKYAATPSPDNPARAVQKRNPNALQEELIRHLEKDSETSCFGLQFLDAKRMTCRGNA